jgi:hypothetical protein
VHSKSLLILCIEYDDIFSDGLNGSEDKCCSDYPSTL